MSNISEIESAVTDAVDHQIIHAVQTFGRAPYALMAEVIGVSEQTVARRYRRLESTGLVHVVGLGTPEALGAEQWLLRIQCRPDAAASLAGALARRTDVSWVSLSAGGSEVVCSAVTRRGSGGQDLLLNRLPRTAQVQGLSAHSILHHFRQAPEWCGYGDQLDADQLARLSPPAGTPGAPLDADDAPLMTALGRNGRASLRRLADDTGWSPARVGRRIDQLLATGAIYFDVDLDMEALGFASMSYIWVTVAPRDVEAVGDALSHHDEVAFCAAVSGSANLILAVVCRDSADLYRYVTTKIGALDAVQRIEVSPVLRRIKQAGTVIG